MIDLFARLEEWYRSHCDGDWEHSYGIEIGTLDNPGWSVKIDLTNTQLVAKPFNRIEYGVQPDNPDDWLSIWIESEQFQGVGDPSKLPVILKAFFDWMDAAP